ncbi:MAG: hypothetical protein KatS3mg061_0729 [Dehalococcoidia bacterium]|nr:MAG: hypothetical protein KatS3mg061_0729 [Dehalococcoidia bacterium]
MDRTLLRDDDLQQIAAYRALLEQRLPLEPLPVPEHVRYAESERGWEDLLLFRAPKIERITLHRFFAYGRVREHLCLGWPAEDYDFPAIGLDLYEHAASFTLVADLLPMQDLAFHRDYYDRYLRGYQQVLTRWWPQLLAHVVQPLPPPPAYFTNQLGSCLALHLPLQYTGLEEAQAFQREVLSCWLDVWEQAEPLPEAERAAYNHRREVLIRQAYKRSDYESIASKVMASVVGWETTNGIFDAVFGP